MGGRGRRSDNEVALSSHSHSRVTRDGVTSLGERGENSEESGEEHVGDVVGFVVRQRVVE